MTIDDRLRGAYRRQLDDVRRRLDDGATAEAHRLDDSRPRPLYRTLAVAAAVVVAGLGSIAVLQAVSDTGGATTDAGRPGLADPEPATSSSATTSHPPPTRGRAATVQAPTPLVPAPTAPQVTGEASTTTSDATSTAGQASTTGPPSAGVANAVCESGARAELEWASLRYVGDSRGWGRMADLVDEQDGPYYFEAWEPNYPDPVAVEVVLREPVLAVDVRVAQDPFTPVSGAITLAVDGEEIVIELSGTDGWRVHRFAEPRRIDRFTIRRDVAASNVMEVLLCVDPAP